MVWDMEHVYFMVGDTVLRQVNGLPMGSPPSPVLANLTCGLGYEMEYINRLETAEGERIWGIRMMMMALLIRNSLAALINYVLGPYAGSQ